MRGPKPPFKVKGRVVPFWKVDALTCDNPTAPVTRLSHDGSVYLPSHAEERGYDVERG